MRTIKTLFVTCVITQQLCLLMPHPVVQRITQNQSHGWFCARSVKSSHLIMIQENSYQPSIGLCIMLYSTFILYSTIVGNCRTSCFLPRCGLVAPWRCINLMNTDKLMTEWRSCWGHQMCNHPDNDTLSCGQLVTLSVVKSLSCFPPIHVTIHYYTCLNKDRCKLWHATYMLTLIWHSTLLV